MLRNRIACAAIAALFAMFAQTGSSFVPDRPPPVSDKEERVGEVRVLGEHDNFFTARFSPDGRLAVSGGGGELTVDTNQWIAGHDFDVRLWDVKTGVLVHRLKHAASVFAVFAPDSKSLLTTSGKTIRVWDVQSGKLLRQQDAPSPVGSAAWSRDGKFWLIAGGDGNVCAFDAGSGKLLRTFLGHTHTNVESVAFAPDNKRGLSSGYDGTVRIWNLETAQQERTLIANGGMRVRQAVWAPDGASIFAAGADNIIHHWDVPKGQEIRRFVGHKSYVESTSCSPDGKRLLSASLDGTIRLWEVSSGKEIHRIEYVPFKNRHRTIVHIDFSPDGRYALSSGWDKTLRLWRLPD